MVTSILKREISEYVVIGIFAINIVFILGLIFGFIQGGFTDQDYYQKYFFYNLMLIAAIMGLTFLFIYNIFVNKTAEFLMHNPNSPTAKIMEVAPWLKHMGRLALVSIIIFSWYAFITSQASGQTFFFHTGVPILQVPQQIAESARIYSFTEPAATAETLTFLFLFDLILIAVSRKSKNKKSSVYVAKVFFFEVILLTPLWIGFHLLRYGGQEIAITQVAFFWLFGTLLVLLTGSIIPFWIWHIFNNIYAGIHIVYSHENNLILITSIQIVITVLCVAGLILLRNRKSNYESGA